MRSERPYDGRSVDPFYKTAYHAGLIVYLILTTLSVIFYRERCILLDSAYDIFHFLRGTILLMNITRSRIMSLVPKAVAIVLARSKAPANSVMVAYSLGFAFFHFICFVITGSVLKKYSYATAILLFNLIALSETFYFIPNELPLGMSFFTMIVASIADKKFNPGSLSQWLFLSVAGIITAFFHPLMIFVLAYTLLFFTYNRGILNDLKLLFVIGAAFLLTMIFKSTFLMAHYDMQSMSGLQNIITFFPHYFGLYSEQWLLTKCITGFFWLTLFFLAVLIFLYQKGDIRQLSGFVAIVLGYVMLICISYPDAATPTFYREDLYLPLSVFIVLPIVFLVIPEIKSGWFRNGILLLVMATACIRILLAHQQFTDRLAFENSIIRQYTGKKVVLGAKAVHSDPIQMLWGTPYETLLLSISEGLPPASIVIDDDPDWRPWVETLNKSLIVNWNVYSYTELPRNYFPFNDTTSRYCIIK